MGQIVDISILTARTEPKLISGKKNFFNLKKKEDPDTMPQMTQTSYQKKLLEKLENSEGVAPLGNENQKADSSFLQQVSDLMNLLQKLFVEKNPQNTGGAGPGAGARRLGGSEDGVPRLGAPGDGVPRIGGPRG